MIVYQKNRVEFIRDVRDDTIAEQVEQYVFEKLGRKTPKSEIGSWQNSLRYMRDVVEDPEIPDDCGISIEYQVPGTNRRIDFIVSGEDEAGRKQAVIVELKQWSSAEVTNMDGMVRTFLGRAQQLTRHPSYQAWSYASYLESFNENVYVNEIGVQPCAFLHNYPQKEQDLFNPLYQSHLEKAPLFRKSEATKLANFIKRFVKKGDSGEVVYEIEHGKIRPSKALADSLVGMIKGNQEFVLIDEQKDVYEIAKAKTIELSKTKQSGKIVIIVEGGPGTGKSVVAINLLVNILGKRLNCHYVTKNSAPREVFQAKLTGTLTKTQYSNLFKSSGSYIDGKKNEFDLLVVDEAHRLNEKSGMFKKGENQIKEIINAAQVSVFFVDSNQRVAFSDIGTPENIENQAKASGSDTEILHLSLPSQFRCSGSDGYLAWVDSTLVIKETPETYFGPDSYDLRIYDNPKKMYEDLLELDGNGKSARLLAGYCWPWVSKKNPLYFDIEFEEFDFHMRWNDFNLGQGWIMHPESVEQVGCIHTSQGLEIDYAGVIIGADLKITDNVLTTDPLAHPGQDKNFSGLRARLRQGKAEKEKVLQDADLLIKNTYRTLMTRGMKGTFIYCEDPNLQEYIRQSIANRMI